MEDAIEISVIMPCLNEEKAVGLCIEKCFKVFRDNKIKGEVVVVDNGSEDRSKEIIIKSQARLIEEPRRGYGSAYIKGFSEAKGRYLIMGDADDTYNFFDIPKFLEPLKNGYDFVIGDRLSGKIKSGNGSMPWLHRYIGNPVLTKILKVLFGVKVSDAHCGMRSITKNAYNKLFLKTIGMEFASEMIINAKKANLKIKEVPINYRLRIGESKLRTFKDGWRHLRFMLLYSPTALFLIPGAVLFISGLLVLFVLSFGPIFLGRVMFDFHYMFLGGLFALAGYQILNLGFFTKIYAYTEKFEDERRDKVVSFFSRHLSLERMILGGALVFLIGFMLFGWVVVLWGENKFGNLFEVRKMIISLVLMILGIQTFFNGFFYSILRIEKK